MTENNFLRGTVISNHRWTDRLHSLTIKAAVERFKPGQFGRLGLKIEGKQVSHPYSFVNSSHIDLCEFYSIAIRGGILSPRLYELAEGSEVLVNKMANGFFVLDELGAGQYLWMLATGTALGPFLSILGTDTPWCRFEHIVLVHAVRYTPELTYRDRINKLLLAHSSQLVYIPFISREEFTAGLCGRVPAAIEDGRLEARANIDLSPDTAQVMICGNPAMVKDTMAVLVARGMRRNRRSSPGNITTENYWQPPR